MIASVARALSGRWLGAAAVADPTRRARAVRRSSGTGRALRPLAWAVVALSLLFGPLPPLAADSGELAAAKHYFKAGAAAYEAGDYLAAIQALDAAYRITPLPAIAFSLAQAERRQYFVSHERAHLERAIDLFRGYLQASSAGRRADATDALGQLEPLALKQPSAASGPGASAEADRTRLMISCETPHATITLDAGAPHPSPLIAQVTPGAHRVVANAEGFFPTARTVEALASELVPIEIGLREKPAELVVSALPEADLHIDGTFVGEIRAARRLELAAGSHILHFSKTGYRVQRLQLKLAPGTTRSVRSMLQPTTKRSVALGLLIASGVSVAVSSVLASLAIDREKAAMAIETRSQAGNISRADLDTYREALRNRERMRIAAGLGFGVAAAAVIAGLLLYAFDPPQFTHERSGDRPEIRVEVPFPGEPRATIDLRTHF
jgi:hypothetical protein